MPSSPTFPHGALDYLDWEVFDSAEYVGVVISTSHQDSAAWVEVAFGMEVENLVVFDLVAWDFAV